VHKISIYIHIYKKMKGKRKEISSASWAGGDFGLAERGRARPRGQVAHLARERGNDAGPRARGRGRLMALGGGDGGGGGGEPVGPDRR
jgi:hypothetical protein